MSEPLAAGQIFRIGLAFRMGERVGQGTYVRDEATGMVCQLVKRSGAVDWCVTTHLDSNDLEQYEWILHDSRFDSRSERLR